MVMFYVGGTLDLLFFSFMDVNAKEFCIFEEDKIISYLENGYKHVLSPCCMPLVIFFLSKAKIKGWIMHF